MKVVNCCVKQRERDEPLQKKKNPRQKLRGWRMLDGSKKNENPRQTNEFSVLGCIV
jgi:hypothetical protein